MLKNLSRAAFGLLGLLVFSSCSYQIHSDSYKEQYSHLNQKFCSEQTFDSAPYYLVIMVEARHLDYSHAKLLIRTLAKHPSDGTKNGDVGHTWIYLKGIKDGCPYAIEGGHSGELGIMQPRYMDGFLDAVERGESNPISYFWTTQPDGFFQTGAGGHYPTFAAAIVLTEDQFFQMLKYIESMDFSEYAITGNQCCTLAAQLAAFAGVDLESSVTVKLDPCLSVADQKIVFWTDPVYEEFTFYSPDILEKSLIQAVTEGKAYNALPWYKKRRICRKGVTFEDLILFPKRYLRYRYLKH